MTTYARQFEGHVPHGAVAPKRPPNPAGRPPDALSDHAEKGKVGSLHAVARELGVTPNALHMQKRNRADFPEPVVGHVYAVEDIKSFRGDCGCEH
jgi:hypothetical protein